MVDDGCGRSDQDASLPARPNGVRGFVAARDVDVYAVHTRISVDLSERRLCLQVGEEGTRSRGRHRRPGHTHADRAVYVNQRLVARPVGPVGTRGDLHLRVSDVLQEWSQGGPIAIHGTNEPGSIGEAVSHGCIRLPNATLRRLFAATPCGHTCHDSPVDAADDQDSGQGSRGQAHGSGRGRGAAPRRAADGEVLHTAQSFRERLDEVAMRIRAIDPLEKRVTELEQRLAALEGKPKPKRAPAKPKAPPKPDA